MTKQEMADEILVDLVFDDIMNETNLVEGNQKRDAAGKFTSGDAGAVYAAGALAAGRAAGIEAKRKGLWGPGVKGAIRDAISAHLKYGGTREAGQERLAKEQKKMKKHRKDVASGEFQRKEQEMLDRVKKRAGNMPWYRA